MGKQKNFDTFKTNIIATNENTYGEALRKQYGNDTIDASNKKIQGMSQSQWEESEKLGALINETLKEALLSGDPSSEIAQKMCELHRKWLCMFWKDGTYTKEAHLGLGEMYCADERFTAYYDSVATGATDFLYRALQVYCTSETL